MQSFDPPVPPPPNISRPGIMAIDITDRFKSAVNTLAPGELVKDEHFTLFESVSALEIMDPKMDSGVLEQGESLDEEYDVSRELLPVEILGIINQLLCLEMAWHLGYPLSQTLLTSVYVEAMMNPHPRTIDEADFTRGPPDPGNSTSLMFVLRAYCAGMLRTCAFVNDIVKEELYYEEEDFVTNTYDRYFLYDIPSNEILDLLNNAWGELHAVSVAIGPEICASLAYRIEFRIKFLLALEQLVSRDINSESPAPLWIEMRKLVDDIEIHHELEKPVPEAFSTKLQRRLASTMPPRPMVKLGFEECIVHFKRFSQTGIEVMDVLNYKDPQSLLNFILTFQRQKPQPSPFIRTILQNLLFKDMVVLGRYSIRQLIDHDVGILVLPDSPHLDRGYDDVEIPTDARYLISSQMEVFRQRVADVYLDTFRFLCQNRCRVRRTLCHHIQEWDAMEADVGEIEERLKGPLSEIAQPGQDFTFLPLTSWAYVYKLQQMEWVVQLGFELTVYQPDELASMYYYLKGLATLRAQHIESIKHITTTRQDDSQASQMSETPDYDSDFQYARSKQYHRVAMLDAARTWEFADGLSLLYTALLRLGLLKPPPRPYSSDKLRYEIRMRPFSRVSTPQLPSYEVFSEHTTLRDVGTAELLRFAEAAVAAARRGFEASLHLSEGDSFSINATAYQRWISDKKDCLRATIAAGVAISTLKKGYERLMEAKKTGSSKETAKGEDGVEGEKKLAESLKIKVEVPEPEDAYHNWWIVPKLTPLR
ncbi:Mak10-domain-containing protein [Xylariaceae sp. FL1019]|nr:Mak10-domain-containing protein [Xylariaceae sp. FL1019]